MFHKFQAAERTIQKGFLNNGGLHQFTVWWFFWSAEKTQDKHVSWRTITWNYTEFKFGKLFRYIRSLFNKSFLRLQFIVSEICKLCKLEITKDSFVYIHIYVSSSYWRLSTEADWSCCGQNKNAVSSSFTVTITANLIYGSRSPVKGCITAGNEDNTWHHCLSFTELAMQCVQFWSERDISY